MVNNETVVIVGAGASCEANLPSGSELTARIAGIVDMNDDDGLNVTANNPLYLSALRLLREREGKSLTPVDDYVAASRQIKQAMPQVISIDNFIDMHAGDKHIQMCGKLAIAAAILTAERLSHMHVDPKNIYNTIDFAGQLRGTWYSSFVKLLTENCRAHELQERLTRLTLVVFNYDRCIEHYLYHSFPNLYRRDISQARAAELIAAIDIVHPYGVVGELPWQKPKGIGFGHEAINAPMLIDLTAHLSTFTEELQHDDDTIDRIRAKIQSARYLIFLGFAFHRQNVRLLFPDSGKERNKSLEIFATGYGMSKSACAGVKTDLRIATRADNDNIHVVPEYKCSRLFEEYWYQLALR